MENDRELKAARRDKLGQELFRLVRELSPPLSDMESGLRRLERALAEGADLEARDGQNRTALFVAVHCGAVEGVRALIAAGAIVDAVSGARTQTALCAAAGNGEFEMCAELINAGALPLADRDGDTPLHKAARLEASERSRAIIELMLRAGCQADQKNRCGETAADVAHSRWGNAWNQEMSHESLLRELARAAGAQRERQEIAAELEPGIVGPRLRM